MLRRAQFKLNSRAGLTLMEMVVTLIILTIVVFGASTILSNASISSDRTQTQSELDDAVALAYERVNLALLECRKFTISDDGSTITFRYPSKSGDYYRNTITETDGVDHTIAYSNGALVLDGDNDNPILTNIPSVDPRTGSAIRVFQAGLKSREVVVRLVSQQANRKGTTFTAALTGRVRPRNFLEK